ncbi:MAG TPA: ATP-binding cassette domain-containing protein [Ramlibacter sp.]|nr:ATP-binding cassette domain-containing protein [Ramlibacter sp.]
MSALLEVRGLRKSYRQPWLNRGSGDGWFHAVKNVSLSLNRGETYAVVGESGAGKSTLGRLILRLIEPDAGSVICEGRDMLALPPRQLRLARAGMQMVFQDPYSSLDPKMSIGASVAEPLVALTPMAASEREARVADLLTRVGLGGDFLHRFPHELSGGQLQRVAIARAISTNPGLVVCDEPVAALDMSIRAQVLNLLRDLQEERGISYIFITHDLSLVSVLAHEVAVMRLGEVVEQGNAEQVFRDPQQAYTRELLRSIPSTTPRRRNLIHDEGALAPLPLRPTTGSHLPLATVSN